MPFRNTLQDALVSKKELTQNITPIADVPDAPTFVSATNVAARAYNNGAGSISLTAAATGGAPTTYTVTSSPGGFSGTSASPVVVTGLAGGTNYTFTAVANNTSASTSPSVAAGSISCVTVPNSPTISSVNTNILAATISFTFTNTSPNNGGASVTSYLASSSSGVTASGASSPLVINETSAGTRSYSVAAINAQGTSAASATVLGTTAIATVTGGTSQGSDATYYYRSFTNGQTFSVSDANLPITALVVGGGGGGGSGLYSGGGGAGGVLEVSGTLVIGTTYTANVGAAGTATVTGGNSSITNIASSTAYGGGRGADGTNAAGTGNGTVGSGGGASTTFTTVGTGTTGQGNSGGTARTSNNFAGGGGGGAGGAGGNAGINTGGTGGVGRALSYGSNGASVTYAVGGAGVAATGTGASGTTAGGGGGAGATAGASGVDGTIVIRYLKTQAVG